MRRAPSTQAPRASLAAASRKTDVPLQPPKTAEPKKKPPSTQTLLPHHTASLCVCVQRRTQLSATISALCRFPLCAPPPRIFSSRCTDETCTHNVDGLVKHSVIRNCARNLKIFFLLAASPAIHRRQCALCAPVRPLICWASRRARRGRTVRENRKGKCDNVRRQGADGRRGLNFVLGGRPRWQCTFAVVADEDIRSVEELGECRGGTEGWRQNYSHLKNVFECIDWEDRPRNFRRSRNLRKRIRDGRKIGLTTPEFRRTFDTSFSLSQNAFGGIMDGQLGGA